MSEMYLGRRGQRYTVRDNAFLHRGKGGGRFKVAEVLARAKQIWQFLCREMEVWSLMKEGARQDESTERRERVLDTQKTSTV